VGKLDNEITRLKRYINCSVKLSIRGDLDEEQAPLFHKQLYQVVKCSDGKHLKFYLDEHTFVAVPLLCVTSWDGEQLTALDEENQLQYQFQFVL